MSKGTGVVIKTFGGEGTGGQAHLVFNWVSGKTYKFIARIRPDGSGSTPYSAWFFAPEKNSWRYLAIWRRPSTNTYQSGVHSFLENFLDTRGYTGRRVQYGNQRKDYAGGLENGRFYLRNGAFFPDYVPFNQNFNRPATGQQPTVNVNTLSTQ